MTTWKNGLAAVLLLIASRPGAAMADEPEHHVVKAHETCAAIAQRYYGDSRLVDVIHRANPALFSAPPPHNLQEGMVLVIPPRPSAASGPDAQLTTVRNHVEVLTPETKQGKPNDPLFRGNRVSTQDASAADVTFRDETQVKLGERTLVIILGDSRSAAAKADETQTTLLTGNLRAWMAGPRRDSAAAIATSAAGVRVFSGEAQVSSDAKKTTRLAVYSGSATITAQNRTREVSRGFGSKAEMGQEPTPPRPLPSAPTWSVLPQPVILDQGAATPSIVGEYAGANVAEWRVQIARDLAFHDVVADTRAPATTHRFEGRAPGPGHYFVRVSAFDDDHFEGPFTRTARVLVVSVKTTLLGKRRRVEIDPPDAYCMRVGNVPLAWVRAPLDLAAGEPLRLRCAPTEVAPTTLLTFD